MGHFFGALLAPSVLSAFPFRETFRLIEACLAVATALVLAAVPLILIGYEHWKERAK